MVVVCGKEVTGTMNTDISTADRLHIICTTLDGLIKIKEKEEIQTSDKWEHIPTHKSSGNIAAPSLCFLLPDNTHRPSPVPSPHPFPASRWMHFSSSETKLDIHVDALAISRSLLFPLLPMQTLHGHCPAYNKHRSLQCLLSHSLLPPPQGWLFLLRQRDLRFYHPAHKSE